MKLERLGDITKNLDNRRIPLNSEQRITKSKKGLFPYIGANNIVGYIDEYIFNERILCIAEDGGSWGTNQTCAVIYEGKTWVNNHAHVLVENGKASLDFLRCYLNFTNLNKYIKGATRGKLNKGILENILIHLPSLSDQIQIANILSKAESLIEHRKQGIVLLDKFLKSTFLEMFGTSFSSKKCEEKKMIRELLLGISNDSPLKFPNKNYEYIDISSIDNDSKKIKETKNILGENAPSRAKQLVQVSDILVSTVRPNLNAIAMVRKKYSNLIASTGFCVLRPNQNLILPEYLFEICKQDFFIEILSKVAKGASYPAVTDKQIKEIKIPVPSPALQTQFAHIVNKIETLKEQYNNSLHELENLYGSLSQKAFKGELRIQHEESLSMAAEPETPYSKTSSIPKTKKGFAKQVLGGKIVLLFKDDKNFTHIKFQKLQYLAEHIAEEDLLWNYYRQTAGPYDNKFMHNVANKLKQNKWFEERNYRFYPLQKVGDIEKYYQNYFSSNSEKLNSLFSLLKNASEKLCEAIATIYAVWNNHLIQKQSFDKEKIKKNFFDWSKRKDDKFTEDEFEKALQWMQKHAIIPTGFGQLIKEKIKNTSVD